MGHLPLESVAGPGSGPATSPPTSADWELFLRTREEAVVWQEAWQFLALIFPDVRRAVLAAVWTTGSPTADGDDIVQDVLLQLHAVLCRGGMPREPRAWARTVARRYAWQAARRRIAEQPMAANELIALGGFVDETDKLAELAERDQLLSWVRQLSPARRAVVALYIDGYPPAEIAYRLQVSPKVVRIRLAAAREQLREALVVQMDRDHRAEQAEQDIEPPRRVNPVPQQQRTGPSADELAAQRALANLPPRQKEVLRLSRRGYKPAQIARVLGLSANTVRVNLCHARKRMRNNLELISSQEAQTLARHSPDTVDPEAGLSAIHTRVRW